MVTNSGMRAGESRARSLRRRKNKPPHIVESKVYGYYIQSLIGLKPFYGADC